MIPRRVGDLPASVLARGEGDAVVSSVAMDSRAVTPGALFVAIRGGRAHVGEAVRRGASAVLVEGEAGDVDAPCVLTSPDVVAALGAIGAANRAAATACEVVAVTGSSGKTSTKDALAALVAPQRRTVAALEGHNNEIGLPFTLARIEADTEVALCELSMRGPGQIAYLADLARPRIGVITNIGEAHLELLGSRTAIADAKCELLAFLEAAVLPADEPLLPSRVPAGLEVVTFGDDPSATVRIVARTLVGDRMHLELDVAGRGVRVDTNLIGRHHALNLAASLATARLLGLDLDACAAAAGSVALQRWRSETHPLPAGGIVVNDAYNANPSSTRAALAALAERGQGRLVAVLGPMAAREEGYAVVVAVGPAAAPYLTGAGSGVEGIAVAEVEGLAAVLADIVRPGDRVLVKASRSVGLERVAQDLSTLLAKGAGS